MLAATTVTCDARRSWVGCSRAGSNIEGCRGGGDTFNDLTLCPYVLQVKSHFSILIVYMRGIRAMEASGALPRAFQKPGAAGELPHTPGDTE